LPKNTLWKQEITRQQSLLRELRIKEWSEPIRPDQSPSQTLLF
jgi:hypothetical protein